MKQLLVAAMLVFAGAAIGAQTSDDRTTASERARAVEKIKEINRWGPEHRIVADLASHLDELIVADANGEILLGWGLTNDQQAYRFLWTDYQFSAEKLSPEEAADQGFRENSMTVTRSEREADAPRRQFEPITQQEAFERGHLYYISDAALSEPEGAVPPGQPLRGEVRLVRSPEAKGDVVLSLKWAVRDGGMSSSYFYPEVPPGDAPKIVAFEFGAPRYEKAPEQYREGVNAVLRVMARPPKGQAPVTPLSNALPLRFRVVSEAENPAAPPP